MSGSKRFSRHKLSAVLATALGIVAAAPSHALPFTQTVSFGDSLTDTGYFTGFFSAQRAFTTNPDRIWIEYLAEQIGGQAKPANFLLPARQADNDGSGTNYAVGGARTVTQDLYPNRIIARYITTVTSQIAQHLAKQPTLDPNGMYPIWAGANDILASLQTNAAALAAPATQAATVQTVLADVQTAAENTAGLVSTLLDAGAGTVMVLNLPDLGRTPLANQQKSQAIMSGATLKFNTVLGLRIAALKGQIVMLNVQGLLDEVTDAPAAFGLTNVVSPACTSTEILGRNISAQTCKPDTLVAPDANQTYLFADAIHPTGIGHKLLGDYAVSVLQAPSRIGLLAEAPLSGAIISQRTLARRLMARSTLPGTQAYAYYDRANTSLQSTDAWQPGFHNGVNALTIGLDHSPDGRLVLGAALTHAQHKSSFGSGAGNFHLNQTLLSAYAQYRIGPWATSLTGAAGYLDYGTVARDFSIGATRLRERGSTDGTQSLISAATRYDLTAGDWTISPIASLTAQRIEVGGFGESRGGTKATSMYYQGQNRYSLVSSLGLALSTTWETDPATLHPYASVAWEHEHRDDARKIEANVRGMAGSFSRPAYAVARNTTVASLGVDIAVGKTTNAQLAYLGRYAGDQRSHGIQVGLAHRY